MAAGVRESGVGGKSVGFAGAEEGLDRTAARPAPRREDAAEQRVIHRFEQGARGVLSLMIVVILGILTAGIVSTAYDIRLIFSSSLHEAMKTLLLDLLTLLAMVEILRTALAYFSEGRVKVTYIIDTVIVTVLTEVMAFWYRDLEWHKIALAISLVISLMAVRVAAVRFSPRRVRDKPSTPRS